MIDWSAIESKWQKKWHDEKHFEVEPNEKKKFFVTVAYPYPNSPQHVGHGRTYTLADVHARFMRMRGYNVLFPMGFHYTGTPILGMARRVQENDQELINAFRTLYKVPEQNIKKFSEPVEIASYFHQEIKSGMIEMGYSIDWRREFTTIDPVYNKFIEWQFRKLKSKNLVIQGSHPVGWCPKDQNPVSQHDTLGDVEPSFTEYVLIKFRYDDHILPTATLRPETIFGVTNLWINPSVTYKIADVDGESWIVSTECAKKLEFLDKKVKIVGEIKGSELVGKKVKMPERIDEITIFPASFVKSQNGTGIVMSVPAHAPFDYQALEDIKKNTNEIEQSLLSIARSIHPISIIQTKEYGEIPAKEVVEKYKIENQNSPHLEEATKELYGKEFYGGRLKQNTSQFAGKMVADAKDDVKKWILNNKNADILFELNDGPIRCRCGAECVVKILNNQWFLDYSNQNWKNDAHSCINNMQILPEDIRNEFNHVVDWLRERACARQHGLGTKLPWDKDWIVESLSDSVIYMAYYIIAKYVNKKQLMADNLKDEFFEYVFFGNGNLQKISSECNVSQEIVEQIRNDFSYFYPVNSRHSGRDLVPNHLTFFVFNHIAIFPKKYWPEEIVVNGSVLMDGKKMSKSMGNIIPLRDAIRTYGADPIRLAILISAELLQDADFNLEAVKGIKNKLENLLEDCSKYKSNSNKNIEQEDRWLQSRLQQLVLEITTAMEKMRLREALHYVLYEFDSDIQWYLKRINAKNRSDMPNVLHDLLSARVAMLSPFAPHVTEEMWEKLGNQGLASKAPWPSVHSEKIDMLSIQSESLLKSTMEDIRNILKVTKMTPKKIIIYTSDIWKTKAYQKILASITNGEMNIGVLIKSLISDKETEQVKKDPDFVKKTVNDILSESAESREAKTKTDILDEKKILSELDSLVQKEIGVKVQVFSESDQAKYDPKNKARTARPFKPAILIE
ncbi:MAG TPA: leucine--tRNA ligase [Nitrosopumilaceae archaeon]|nr:leucine--tRNA ligase [Nitrosopumilaceae archaeon]